MNLNKLLKIFIVLFLLFSIVSALAFLLMKKSKENNETSVESSEVVSNTSEIEQGDYTEEHKNAAEKLKFLKLDDFDAVRKYADESEIYIMNSDSEITFGIGELYIKEIPVFITYMLNDESSINLLSGTFSVELNNNDLESLRDIIYYIDRVIFYLFGEVEFEHSIFSSSGYLIDCYSDESYTELLNGEATYHVSVIDEKETYWKIKGSVTEQKNVVFSFLRSYDFRKYEDNSPNMDLRKEDIEDLSSIESEAELSGMESMDAEISNGSSEEAVSDFEGIHSEESNGESGEVFSSSEINDDTIDISSDIEEETSIKDE